MEEMVRHSLSSSPLAPTPPTRATRGALNTAVAARPRPVQGPARPHPPRLRRCLFPPRIFRGLQ